MFIAELATYERFVTNRSNRIGVIWDQHQYDAFVSFAFNTPAWSEWAMNKIANGADPHQTFSQIISSNGKKSLGLYRRRMDEADIFAYGTYNRTYRGC